MTEPLSDAEISARIAQFDQQHAGAVDLARVVAAQYETYRNVGIPVDSAVSLVEMYLESVISQTEYPEDE